MEYTELLTVFAWPLSVALMVIVLGIFFMIRFRESLAEFIGRVRKISKGGIDAADRTAQNVAKAEQDQGPSSEELMRVFDSPILLEQEAEIKKDLEEKGPKDPAQKINVLIRHLAGAQIGYRFEATYSMIFGSQIAILEHLNPLGEAGDTIEGIREFYELSCKRYPEFYKAYSFDRYLSFLESSVLIKKANGRICITVAGREFLTYLAKAAKFVTKPY